jgi:hypothetical protein
MHESQSFIQGRQRVIGKRGRMGQRGRQCLDPAGRMQPAPERGAAGMRAELLIGKRDRDCFAPAFKVKSPQPPFGEPGVCPTIVLFSSTTNQFLSGGLCPTESFRLRKYLAQRSAGVISDHSTPL